MTSLAMNWQCRSKHMVLFTSAALRAWTCISALMIMYLPPILLEVVLAPSEIDTGFVTPS